MTKAQTAKLESLAQDFLQYRYTLFLHFRGEYKDKADPNYLHYKGACDMIDAFGGEWRRVYKGDDSEEAINDIRNYSHIVRFPDADRINRLNLDRWK